MRRGSWVPVPVGVAIRVEWARLVSAPGSETSSPRSNSALAVLGPEDQHKAGHDRGGEAQPVHTNWITQNAGRA